MLQSRFSVRARRPVKYPAFPRSARKMSSITDILRMWRTYLASAVGGTRVVDNGVSTRSNLHAVSDTSIGWWRLHFRSFGSRDGIDILGL
jgi:hypothetical protein